MTEVVVDRVPAGGLSDRATTKDAATKEANVTKEVYTGYHPLAVACSRGEQKAIQGDTIVTMKEENIVYILPREVVSVAEYSKAIHDAKAKETRELEDREAALRGEKPKSRESLREPNESHAPSHAPAIPAHTPTQTQPTRRPETK